MKAQGRMVVWRHTFLISVLDGGELSVSCSGRLTPGHSLKRRLVGPQNQYGRFEEEKHRLPLPGIEPRFVGCLAHSLVTRPIQLSRISNVQCRRYIANSHCINK